MKKFQNKKSFNLIVELLTIGICRPVVSYGYGRYITYRDYTDDILAIINTNSVEIGNDAPRGGKLGKFIKIKNVKISKSASFENYKKITDIMQIIKSETK